MSLQTVLQACPVVPVVTIDAVDLAVPLAEALLSAGIKAIEITLRTECAVAAIESVAKAVPGIAVGAGSIRRLDHIQTVVDAGATFCVSPGFTHALLDEAAKRGVAFIPGIATASEILAVTEHDIHLVKFFPAEVNGGVPTLKALSAPLPEITFFPTGGVNPGNVASYLALKAVVCVGGSWFVPGDALAARDFDRIEQLSREALIACRG